MIASMIVRLTIEAIVYDGRLLKFGLRGRTRNALDV